MTKQEAVKLICRFLALTFFIDGLYNLTSLPEYLLSVIYHINLQKFHLFQAVFIT